jgi:threonine dehydrogenase-like Zn-dependent dehydrogenase
VSGRDTLAVFGQGPVGLSATMLGVAMGARVIAVDIAAERLGLATEFGADAVINSRETDPVKAIMDLTHGEGAEATMDCTGLPDPRVAAVRSTATWGRMCFVGEGGATSIDVSRDLIRKQLTLVASWTFSTMGQWECARFVADRKIPLGRIFTDRFDIDQAAEAYKRFDTQTTGKGVFTSF